MEWQLSCNVPEDFELGDHIDAAQNAIYPLHHLIFNQVLAAVAALQNRKIFDDHDTVIVHFERQVRSQSLELASANMTSHPFLLILRSPSHSSRSAGCADPL